MELRNIVNALKIATLSYPKMWFRMYFEMKNSLLWWINKELGLVEDIVIQAIGKTEFKDSFGAWKP